MLGVNVGATQSRLVTHSGQTSLDTLPLGYGIRKCDLLRLRLSDRRPEGLRMLHSKTAESSGRETLYQWTDARWWAWEAAIAARPIQAPPNAYLFCTRAGEPYINEEGLCSDFNSIWRRWLDRALDAGVIEARFTEQNLRAKVATDSVDLEQARRRLGHTDTTTTRRHYWLRPEIAD
ncbi:hypothetical protein [Microbulbifer spongiae]|uniref:Tyr recombinase domain-containing protein n=1 Tax=Microbulbifer spongiae TaxID=2944933 RepID=A0ABY9E804_9GAMM|nr:hypothetical protein [Microbulbifer sp. MI-G]WKD49138.1 hypothetical protein M8T91_14735 [Microbulbifer sp. MI-G]